MNEFSRKFNEFVYAKQSRKYDKFMQEKIKYEDMTEDQLLYTYLQKKEDYEKGKLKSYILFFMVFLILLSDMDKTLFFMIRASLSYPVSVSANSPEVVEVSMILGICITVFFATLIIIFLVANRKNVAETGAQLYLIEEIRNNKKGK